MKVEVTKTAKLEFTKDEINLINNMIVLLEKITDASEELFLNPVYFDADDNRLYHCTQGVLVDAVRGLGELLSVNKVMNVM